MLFPNDLKNIVNILAKRVYLEWRELGEKIQFKDEELDSIAEAQDCDGKCLFRVIYTLSDGKEMTLEHMAQLEKALVTIGKTEIAEKFQQLPSTSKCLTMLIC